MATAEEIVAIAASQIGYKESPAGSNNTKYGEWYGMNYNPWCDMFVSWCAAQIGASDVVGKYAYCPSHLYQWFKEKGWIVDRSEKPKPGDIVFFSNATRVCHVAVVEKRIDASYVQTIEGNTSRTSNDNGGAVMRRIRSYGSVGSSWYLHSFGRPPYSQSTGTPENTSETVGGVDNGAGTYTITASELCVRKGAGTNYALVGYANLTADGKLHDADKDSQLEKGTRVTVSETKIVNGDTWGKIPSGWICLYYQGHTYAVKDGTVASDVSSEFKAGTYTITASALKVRTGAGLNYRQKSKSELTADGKKHANASGCLLKGTRVTVSEVVDATTYVWGKIPSGWICLQENGTDYVA